MRVLVLSAHPLDTSFVSALRRRVVDVLHERGHEVDDLDLYAEKFNPVMSAQMMRDYVDLSRNRAEVEPYVERVLAADALVLVYPVWFDGLPSILKGFFERVFLPGVAFKIDEASLFHPTLWNLKRLAAVCTYGECRAHVALKGDQSRRFVKGNIGGVVAPGAPFDYLAHYDMNFTTAPRRARFLQRVTRVFRTW
ncbi:MAG: NAD(P)H-dependent oxidoreductase [Hyphomicrobiales bacterium]|nr:NAD(P)H-dependent oxidoreductase [Hyphomicrobiales bacterium]